MLGIVLAAGDGSRMQPLTHRAPKALVPVAGRPLITYVLSALREAGVHDVVIVDGHLGERIRQALGDGGRYGVQLTFVRSIHTGRGNAASLYVARQAVGDRPFILTMGDHLICPSMIQRLLRPRPAGITLCVDRQPRFTRVSEATLVLVGADGRVRAIGKGLEGANAVDTGLFWLTPAIFDAIRDVWNRSGQPPTLTEALCQLIRRGVEIWAREVWGAGWIDVDTPADLQRAEEVLASRDRGLSPQAGAPGWMRSSSPGIPSP